MFYRYNPYKRNKHEIQETVIYKLSIILPR